MYYADIYYLLCLSKSDRIPVDKTEVPELSPEILWTRI